MATDPQRLLELDPQTYLTPDIVGRISESLSSAVDTVAFLGIGAVHLFVMIALAFYLLRDDQQLADWVVSTADDERGVVVAFGSAVDRDLSAVFFGNILNAVLTGTIGVIAYTILNVFAPAPEVTVPAAGLVGLLAGVASIIPVVGMKLVYVPVAIYMAAVTLLVDPQLLWFVVAFAAVSFVVVDTIPDLVLRPYVSGRSLHVGSVMIAYTFGPLLFGWYGIFLMPMLLVLVFHFARIVLPELIGGYEIRPGAVDPGVLAHDQSATRTDPQSDVGDGVAASPEAEGETDDGVDATADAESSPARRPADSEGDGGRAGGGEEPVGEGRDAERVGRERQSDGT
jgi:predicted PurR-regulated permease PerM